MTDETKEPEKKPPTYYTAFVLFAQDSVTRKTLQLHCTHKYLGEQDNNSMAAVVRMCNKFFESKRYFPQAVFNERVDFVSEHKSAKDALIDASLNDTEIKTVSVLKSFIHKDAFFPELREELDQFRKDDYPDYTPHITIDHYPSITGHFQVYAIMSGEKILVYWRNPKWEAMERAAKAKESQLRADYLRDKMRSGRR